MSAFGDREYMNDVCDAVERLVREMTKTNTMTEAVEAVMEAVKCGIAYGSHEYEQRLKGEQ